MIKVYIIDKVACLKHLAAEDGLSLSYRSKTDESRQMEALQKKKQKACTVVDTTADYGPPDRPSNFQPATRRKKRAQNVTGSSDAKRVALSSKCNYTPNPHPEVLGKNVHMKFETKNGNFQWLKVQLYPVMVRIVWSVLPI